MNHEYIGKDGRTCRRVPPGGNRALATTGGRATSFMHEMKTQGSEFVRSSNGRKLTRATAIGLGLPTLAFAVTLESLVVALVGVACMMLVIGAGVLSVIWDKAKEAPAERSAKEALRVQRARERACPAVTRMMGERDPEWATYFQNTQRIMNDATATSIGDDLALRLTDLNAAFENAVEDAGLSDTTDIRREAHAAITAMVDGAEAARQEVRRIVKARDDERVPEIARSFAQTARSVAGVASLPHALPPPSASAALQLLIGLSEKALAVDPDLVDGNGARLDDLVRRHLPRLLATHAAAARAAAPSGLRTIDDALAEGVEQIRTCIEEALALDARNRFDELRTEVGFLRARRGAGIGVGADT